MTKTHLRAPMRQYLHYTAVMLTFCILPQSVAYARNQSVPKAATKSVDPGMNERVMTIPLRAGGAVRATFSSPDRPRAILIMFPGGTGDIGLQQDGHIRHGNNFVVRTRGTWNRLGYAVLIPDTVNHLTLRGQRRSAQYARLVEDIIAFVHRENSAPIFLVGTSQGTIAAVNAAAHAAPRDIAGIVLTESVSVMGGSQETVFNAHPEKVQAPVLVVANHDDRCNVAPPQDAERIGAAMTSSHEVNVLRVAGGITRSEKNCASLTPHGYFGIEAEVITRISSWLDAILQTPSVR